MFARVAARYRSHLLGGAAMLGAGCAAYALRSSTATECDMNRELVVMASHELTKAPGNALALPHVEFGIPMNGQVMQKRSYVSFVDYQSRIPRWVAEHLTPQSAAGDANRKHSRFSAEKLIPEPFRATNKDYYKSGYSRGHMAPAGQHKDSQDAMDDTFSLSANILPQDHSNNGSDWLRLEHMVRRLSKMVPDVWVVSGPLWLAEYDEETGKRMVKFEVVGKHDVWVPTHLFKVVMIRGDTPGQFRAAAFVMPNKPADEERPLSAYKVPVTNVETAAGLRFFPHLPNGAVVVDLCGAELGRAADVCVVQLDDFMKRRVEGWRLNGLVRTAPTMERLEEVWARAQRGGHVDKRLQQHYDERKAALSKEEE